MYRTELRLLRTVGGKPHANDDHHEEPAYKGRPDVPKKTKRQREQEAEELINAEPMSSDEELQHPAPRPSQTSRRKLLPSEDTDTELKKPQKRSSKMAPAIRAPAKGSYHKGKLEQAKRALHDCEKHAASSQSSIEVSQDKGWEFDDDLTRPPPKKQRAQYGAKNQAPYLKNIHTPASRTLGQVSSKTAPKARGKIQYGRRDLVEPQEEEEFSEEFSDVSMIDIKELNQVVKSPAAKVEDPELPKINVKPKFSRGDAESSKPTTLGDAELISILDEPSKPARLRYQLDNWMQDQAPPSSQPDSSAPQPALGNINDYIDQLSEEEEEGTYCTLCKVTVKQDDYWDFWKGKDKTVKNHTAFCNAHRKKSAQEDYDRENYPLMNWDALFSRIKKHRMSLLQILNNDRPSEYRNRYEPIALTGKAASVPSRRKDLSEAMQKELDSYTLDDQATYPGYYGPHGRRVITEHIMKILKNEIKHCKDPVVQGSGPAAFIQAVLVPEMAILLIMEDCKADRAEAEEIRERTYDMGILLNEEIEDEVEAHYDSEDNAYDY